MSAKVIIQRIRKKENLLMATILTTFLFLLILNICYAEHTQLPLFGKKVVMIIAPNNFRDEEYSIPREILEGQGAKIVVASSQLETATGMLGLKVKPDIKLSDIKVENFDAIIFVGGLGARDYYWDNETALALAKEAYTKGKILGAICLAPVILAKAGVLKDKKATVWSSEGVKLRAVGCQVVGDADVVVDGKIVTAKGPQAAKKFGESILELLKRK